MCTDQLLLDLADRSQIAGLSPFARDAARSWASEKAEGLPILSGTAEEIMKLRPSLVLAGTFTKRATRDFIRERGIAIEEFEPVHSVAQSKRQIARVAALVGAEAAGARRIASLDEALEGLKRAASGRRLRVLPLSRRGWVSGRNSLVSDLLATAGLVNAAGEAGIRSGGFMTLEAIVKLRPDALLISRADDKAEDQGRAMLLHPALAALFPPERRIVMPESLTVCGGPMLVEAMRRLADELDRLKLRDAASP
jgi:iron complex transport system substrate-binding protein